MKNSQIQGKPHCPRDRYIQLHPILLYKYILDYLFFLVFTHSFDSPYNTGTTWMQELVYLIMTDGNFREAKSKKVWERGPFLEVFEEGLMDGIAEAKNMKRPRQLKTHLQYKFFEKTFDKTKPKVIVVMRNLKVRGTGFSLTLW